MVPVPIPDSFKLAPYQRRLVVGPPQGDPTGDIRPVEAILELVDDGAGQHPRFRVLVEIETHDWNRWGVQPPAKPARFWLLQWSQQLVPFALSSEWTPP